MGLLDLFAALGDPLQPVAGKPPKQPTKARQPTQAVSDRTPPVPKVARPSTYWRPLAIVLFTPTWRCTCGTAGSAAPQLMMREQHGPDGGKFTQRRLRAIGDSLTAYPHLPLEVETADPSIIKHCSICTPTFFRTPQLSLPLGLPAPLPVAYKQTPMETLYDEYEEMRIAASASRALL